MIKQQCSAYHCPVTQEGSGFARQLRPFCVKLVCSLYVPVWVFTGHVCFLLEPKDMSVRLTGDSKLVVGVDLSMNGCMSPW